MDMYATELRHSSVFPVPPSANVVFNVPVGRYIHVPSDMFSKSCVENILVEECPVKGFHLENDDTQWMVAVDTYKDILPFVHEAHVKFNIEKRF